MFQEIKIVNNPTAKLDNLSVKRFYILRKDALLKNPSTENVNIKNSSSISIRLLKKVKSTIKILEI